MREGYNKGSSEGGCRKRTYVILNRWTNPGHVSPPTNCMRRQNRVREQIKNKKKKKRGRRYQIHFSIIVNQNAARHSFSSRQRETRGLRSLVHNSTHHVARRWAPGESVVRLYAFMHTSTHIKPLKHRKDIFLTVENKLGQIKREKEKEDDRMLWHITKTHCVCIISLEKYLFILQKISHGEDILWLLFQ